LALCQDLLQQHLVHLQHFGECPGLLPPCSVHAALRAAVEIASLFAKVGLEEDIRELRGYQTKPARFDR